MIKQFLRWAGLVILMYILQTTIVPVISICGIKPDLLMLVLFYCAFRTDVIPAVFAGFFIGLSQDFYSPVILGQNAFAKTIAGFFAGMFNEKVMRIDPLFQMLLILLMFFIHDTVLFAVQVAKSGSSPESAALQLVTFTLPRAIYSLFFALIPAFREYLFPSGIKRL